MLEEEGERELAICARDLRLVADCGCGDDFCQSFYTEARPDGPYGPGHRCVCLLPASGGMLNLPASGGMLNLDVVNERIMYVEVIGRPPLGEGRQAEPGIRSVTGQPSFRPIPDGPVDGTGTSKSSQSARCDHEGPAPPPSLSGTGTAVDGGCGL